MTLKTLENSLNLLKLFTRDKPTWGLRELSREMGINHTIVNRILKTYQQHGFLIQNEETKKYELGLLFLQFGQLVRDKLNFLDMISPFLETLSKKTGESVFLTWLDSNEAVCIKKVESTQNLKFDDLEGSRRPLYVGSRSKVILAYMPIEQQEIIISKGLQKFTSRSVTDPTLLIEELRLIKEKGWAFSNGEYIESVFSLSVPIFNTDKKILGSLSIAGPDNRMSDSKIPETLVVLKETKKTIEIEINKFDSKFMQTFWRIK